MHGAPDARNKLARSCVVVRAWDAGGVVYVYASGVVRQTFRPLAERVFVIAVRGGGASYVRVRACMYRRTPHDAHL